VSVGRLYMDERAMHTRANIFTGDLRKIWRLQISLFLETHNTNLSLGNISYMLPCRPILCHFTRYERPLVCNESLLTCRTVGNQSDMWIDPRLECSRLLLEGQDEIMRTTL